MGNKHFEKGGEELKTLKDLDFDLWMPHNDVEEFEKWIKAEAIKWVKADLNMDYETIRFIKHFFNLTERDLA